jgi:tetratricopeptide (TPR) repeat protein
MRSLPTLGWSQIATVESFTPAEAGKIFHSYLGPETFEKRRQALLDFARRVEYWPIAITVGANLLRRQFGPLGEAARKLTLAKLHDVKTLFARAIESQGKPEQRLLAAGAVCAATGFWMPFAIEIAGLSVEAGETARDNLVNASLLRVLDQDRQRFQMHALLREHLQAEADQLREAHIAALERRFENHEANWRECRECLEEITPASECLWTQEAFRRQSRLSAWGYHCAARIGELEVAFRIMQRNETFWANRKDGEAESGLRRSYCNQSIILQIWGRLDEALALLKKQEAICLELGNRDSLQRSYGNQALILHKRGQLDGALALLEKEEAICLELGNRNDLQRCYGSQAQILQDQGRLEEALALHKMEEAICLELGDGEGLQGSYGNQAIMLKNQSRFDEALALLKQQEEICLELGLKSGLGYCYANWGMLARAQRDSDTEIRKLEQALAIFTELRMARERDAAQADLNRARAAEAPIATSSPGTAATVSAPAPAASETTPDRAASPETH